MPEMRRKNDPESKEAAVRIVRETGKPIAEIARDLGVQVGTLGNRLAKDRAEREGIEGLPMADAAESKRLRAEKAQLRMERDVLKRSVVLLGVMLDVAAGMPAHGAIHPRNVRHNSAPGDGRAQRPSPPCSPSVTRSSS